MAKKSDKKKKNSKSKKSVQSSKAVVNAQKHPEPVSGDKPATKAKSPNLQTVESIIRKIIETGKAKGYLTYEEMNNALPDEAITPNRLDSLLMTLDEMGVQLLDEADAEKYKEEHFDRDQRGELHRVPHLSLPWTSAER